MFRIFCTRYVQVLQHANAGINMSAESSWGKIFVTILSRKNCKNSTNPKMPIDEVLKAWRETPDKDKLTHYQSQHFRQQYDLHEMPKRVKDARKWLDEPIKRLVQRLPHALATVRVLSLGCGPGSDLLAAIESLLNQGLPSQAEVLCTGVDLMPWDRRSFNLRVVQLRLERILAQFPCVSCPKVVTQFHTTSMRAFIVGYVRQLQETGYRNLDQCQFDVISLSYANAKETLQNGMAEVLTALLRPGGSIVIVDNNSARLRQLALQNPGFKTVYGKNSKLVLVYQA